IVALKVGKSQKAEESAIAHTGSMTGSDRVIDTVFKQYGVIRVDDIDELIETTVLFSQYKQTTGEKLAITTTSGGESGLYADLGEQLGVVYSNFDTETEQKLVELMPEFGSIGNPLDTTGNAALSKDLYKKCLTTIANDHNVDIVAVSQMDINTAALKNSETTKNIVESLFECSKETEKPMLCFTPNAGGADKETCSLLMDKGIPLLTGAVSSLKAIKNLIWYSMKLEEKTVNTSFYDIDSDFQPNKKIKKYKGVLTERESQEVFNDYNIPIKKKSLINYEEEAEQESTLIGYPVVMKVEST